MILYAIRKSLRLKLILASVIVEVFMLCLLITNSVRLVNNATVNHAKIYIRQISPMINASLAPLLFQRDFASINDVLDDLFVNPEYGITYISVYDDINQHYATRGDTIIKIFPSLDEALKQAGKGVVINSQIPLTLEGKKIGKAEFSISLAHLIRSKTIILKQSLIIAAIEVILTILLLGTLGFFLTRHIIGLVKGVTDISKGNYAARIDLGSEDEIGIMAKSFNEMADAVEARTKSLERSEEKYRDLVNLAQEGIWVIDTDNLTTFVNPSMAKMLNYTPDEMTGKHLFDFMDEKGVLIAEDNLERRKQGIKEQHDFEFITKSGDRVIATLQTAPIIDDDGNYKGAIAGLIDITKRVRIEKELRQSEERYRTLFKSSADANFLIDIENFNILDVNEKAVELYGYPYDELTTMNALDLSAEPEETKTVLENGKDTIVPIRYHKKKDGTAFPVQITARYFTLDDKEVNFSAVRDITELKQYELRLIQSQKMESIGTLAGGIAHDFNNILASIIGFTELALDEAEKSTTLEDSLQEVYSASQRAKELVKQILTFARQSDEELKPIQPCLIAKEVLHFLRSTIPATIEIKNRIISDSFIMGNATQIHQVLMNLCTNAAQAMEASGGTLHVSVSNVAADNITEINQSNLTSMDYVEIRVSDTGVGIAQDNICSIFEPYFTTKGPGEGTGMGLAVVNGVVEAYGGQIIVNSTEGQGSVFTIYLPVTQKRFMEQTYQKEVLPTGEERILFVDDEEPIAKMGSQTLSRLGYKITTRTSSVEALELFRLKATDFDLVITDMTMPNLTGDRLAVELMKIRPDIPVILCTGYSKKISDELAAEIGIKAFAYKPIVKADLAKTIRKVLDEAKSEIQD